jgi:hypothetical protein
MAYASWSVTFGEQPSAAKWNILGTNDASFNDGTGIATNAITAAKLSTSAIKLGSTTFGSSTSSVTAVAITGGSLTITVPAGGRSVLLIAKWVYYNSGVNNSYYGMWEGAIGGTSVDSSDVYTTPATAPMVGTMIGVRTPVAGSITYNLSHRVAAGTVTTQQGSFVALAI